jgi:hypothetical protein
MHKYPTGAVAFIVLLTLTIAQASASSVRCTSMTSVDKSSEPAANNAWGGHLNAYVKGETPPAKVSQNKKILFESAWAWQVAYTELVKHEPPLMCLRPAPNNGQSGTTLDMRLSSFECVAADKEGRCTDLRPVETRKVTYLMHVVKHEWIVYEAHPVK